jgi:hypothetical protein
MAGQLDEACQRITEYFEAHSNTGLAGRFLLDLIIPKYQKRKCVLLLR